MFVLLSPFVAIEETRAQTTSSEEQLQILFLTGMSALQSGDPDTAIAVFQAMLAQDPTLVRVRLELGRAYAEAGQYSRARGEFFTALSGDLPAPVRDNVLSFIRAIDARRGFEWDLQLSFVPLGDQRNYNTDEIGLDFGFGELPFVLDRSESNEIGIRAVGALRFRPEIGFVSQATNGAASSIVELVFDATDGPGREWDELALRLNAGVTVTRPNLTYAILPTVSHSEEGGDVSEETWGIRGRFEWRNASGLSFFGSASFEDVNVPGAEDEDGQRNRAELGIRRAFGARAVAGVAVFGERREAENTLVNSRIYGVRAFGRYDARWGLTFRPRISYTVTEYPTPNPLFVRSPDENRVSVGVYVEKSDLFLIDGFVPYLDLEYSRATSDIDAFSYDETSLSIGVSRSF